MAKKELSNYQRSVINNYYDNLDTIMLTKLQEIVTDLYLAESKAKQATHSGCRCSPVIRGRTTN